MAGFELLNDDERFLYAHITDLAKNAARSGVPRFSAFLNEREAAVAARAAADSGEAPDFYGGYDGAHRTICGFVSGTYAEGQPLDELFPVRAVTFLFRERDKLCHRDFLGASLALGLKRALLGDILCGEGGAVIFCHENAAELIEGLTKIGNTGVRTEKGVKIPLPEVRTVKTQRVVSSLRLDCIVSAAANVSRDKSASLIKSGQVNADFFPCLDVSAGVRENTIISVRGSGRYRLSEIKGESRKGKIRVVIEKFI